jgi:predicted amidohydrolase
MGIISTPASSPTSPRKLSARTARFICPVIRSSTRNARSSIWRSATSSRAISASTSGARSALIGYNTPSINAEKIEEGPEKRLFHNRLSAQAGAYQNSTWVVCVAKAGVEDGHPLIGSSLIVDPDGEIVAEARTEEDELLVHSCDLDATKFGKNTIFNFALHRRIEHYGLITSQTGAVPPPED